MSTQKKSTTEFKKTIVNLYRSGRPIPKFMKNTAFLLVLFPIGSKCIPKLRSMMTPSLPHNKSKSFKNQTTRQTGGLLYGYKPIVTGQRLKALAFTNAFRQ